MLLAVALVTVGLWLWLANGAWRVDRTWGVLALIAWPITAVLLLGDRNTQLRWPYLFLLVSSLALGVLWLDRPRASGLVMETPDATVVGAIDRRDEISNESSTDDDVTARVRWRRTIDSLSFRHGDIELRTAKASLLLPESFRFIGRAATERVLAVLEEAPADELLGWVIHQSINLAKDDAWAIEVSWYEDGFLALRPLAEIAPERLWILAQYTHTELGSHRERAGYEHSELVEFAIEPRPDNDLVYWAKRLRHANGSEHLDCHALRRGRFGWLEFVSRYLPDDQLELCLRAVRTIAVNSRFDHGAAVRDTLRGDPRSTISLVEIISGRQSLKRLEARQAATAVR